MAVIKLQLTLQMLHINGYKLSTLFAFVYTPQLCFSVEPSQKKQQYFRTVNGAPGKKKKTFSLALRGFLRKLMQ